MEKLFDNNVICVTPLKPLQVRSSSAALLLWTSRNALRVVGCLGTRSLVNLRRFVLASWHVEILVPGMPG